MFIFTYPKWLAIIDAIKQTTEKSNRIGLLRNYLAVNCIASNLSIAPKGGVLPYPQQQILFMVTLGCPEEELVM
jgi:hypothetical protein